MFYFWWWWAGVGVESRPVPRSSGGSAKRPVFGHLMGPKWCDLVGLGLRRAVHSTHQVFGEVTNQITNIKSLFFAVLSHQNVLYDSVAIADLKCISQLNYTTQFGNLKQKNGDLKLVIWLVTSPKHW